MHVENSLKYVEIEINFPNVAAVHLLVYEKCVTAVHRPPSYTVAENFSLMEVITTFCEGHEVVILRNFNLPSVMWSTNVDLYHGVSQNIGYW